MGIRLDKDTEWSKRETGHSPFGLGVLKTQSLQAFRLRRNGDPVQTSGSTENLFPMRRWKWQLL